MKVCQFQSFQEQQLRTFPHLFACSVPLNIDYARSCDVQHSNNRANRTNHTPKHKHRTARPQALLQHPFTLNRGTPKGQWAVLTLSNIERCRASWEGTIKITNTAIAQPLVRSHSTGGSGTCSRAQNIKDRGQIMDQHSKQIAESEEHECLRDQEPAANVRAQGEVWWVVFAGWCGVWWVVCAGWCDAPLAHWSLVIRSKIGKQLVKGFSRCSNRLGHAAGQ